MIRVPVSFGFCSSFLWLVLGSIVIICPCNGCGHCPLPTFQRVASLRFFHSRMKLFLHLPLLLYFADVFPEAYGETGEIRGTKGSGLRHYRPNNFCIEDVGLELHELVID